MSNAIGNYLLHQSFFSPTVLEHQSRSNTSTSVWGNTFLQPQANSLTHRAPTSTEFWGRRLTLQKNKLQMGKMHTILRCTKAVLAADPSSMQQKEKFRLDEKVELQIDVGLPTSGSASVVNIQVSSNSDGLLLHWGAIKKTTRSGANAALSIEIDDPAIEALEFLIYDEAQNKWYKYNGGNFHVNLPKTELTTPKISVPEDLVQIQAYLRGERKGKQMYTPGQEKILDSDHLSSSMGHSSILGLGTRSRNSVLFLWLCLELFQGLLQVDDVVYRPEEYEAARMELLEEVARGTSTQDLRAKLISKSGASESKDHFVSESKSNIPDTEKDTQRRKIQAKGRETNFSTDRVQRRKRDIMSLLTKFKPESINDNISHAPEVLSPIKQFSMDKEAHIDGPIMNKKIYKLGDKELLVLVAKSSGQTKVYLATDLPDPVILHWALSKNAGEWRAPPSTMMPPDSVSIDKAAETNFTTTSVNNQPYKIHSLEIAVEDENFVGMPFVLLSGGNWIKNSSTDFYVEFKTSPAKVQKDAGDGKGTSKVLLEKIADLESEAQKSFVHRSWTLNMQPLLPLLPLCSGSAALQLLSAFNLICLLFYSYSVALCYHLPTLLPATSFLACALACCSASDLLLFNIAADLIDEATSAGEVGLAGILVWMRFMATRQLIWNKNYNVKPREISKAQDRLTDLLQNVYKSFPQYREVIRMIMSTVGRGGEGDVGQRIRDEILVIQRNNDCKGGLMEEWHQKLHNNTSPDDVVICQALMDYIKSDFDISVYWKTLNNNGIKKERLLSYDRAIHSEPNFRPDQKDGLLRDLGHYMRTLKAVHSGADLESAIANCLGYKDEGQGFMVGVQINPVQGLPGGFPELLRFVVNHIEDRNVEALLEGLLEARKELRPLLSQYFIPGYCPRLCDLLYCLKAWNLAQSMFKSSDEHWALFSKSVLDRTRLSLANKAEAYHQLLQPSAEYLGTLLAVDLGAVDIFTEEIIRAGSAASLSSLLNRLDPILRNSANLGSWQIISPVEAVGYVVVVDQLLSVQNKSNSRPTILVAKSVKGEEEIPDGAVAVLTPDMPDVLSHVSVRARNSKVCFATCFDLNILADIRKQEGKLLCLKPTSADVVYSEMKDNELVTSADSNEASSASSLSLERKQFSGRYAIASEEFTDELVGAKSRNIAHLKGKVPSWVNIPTSVALPFGTFEAVLSDKSNQAVAEKLLVLKRKLYEGDFSLLGEIRNIVLDLAAPPQLIKELKEKMQSSGMPWPGDEGAERWEQAWMAIKKVVKGLGETLVGAYPGRALSFICKKNDLKSPQFVLSDLGYPSKPIGLFIRRSIIFRSDSNGEDLEGYAGAGLYDSVPMDEEDKVVLDYSSDALIVDGDFRHSILSNIGVAANAIEGLYGSPQDIEGVVKDGKIYVVQTRPQM
ncbi:hypothetical protein SASPL_110643 [Salvia splendens]|uniref:Pyruvate phosphate dikinase AMP/ATP-binding domain-containing protein n=1 Tax=Salvia splendens TaxID=180675 RepID=A0A8X8Y4Z9_SALSN|nr:hypothetical protein SASPL_110643 [Salvia splendens]